ncbi:hypothetical protein AAG906_027960 [Vitis piasezkii]
MDRASSSPFLIMTYHSDSGSSPLSEGSADSYAFLLSCAPVHQEPSRLLCEGIELHASSMGSSEDLAPPEAELQRLVRVTIERRSPWPFDFCVDRSFLSRSH